MAGEIKGLGKDTLVYGLSTVVARLLNFLLLPFYTHYLAPAEYGIVAVAFTYVAFANVLFQYGMDQAYMRFASGKGAKSADACFATAQLSLAATAAVFSAPLFLFAGPIASAAALGPHGDDLVRYSAAILALDALTIVPFAELRLRRRTWLFAGVKTFNIAVNVVMNVLLLGSFGFGVRGVFLASMVAASSSLVLLAPVAASRLRASFDPALYRELLRFGLPLVPAGLGSMMVQVIDRPILQRLTDEAAVGVYQANYRLGIFMMLIVTMFDQAWRPFFLEHADDPDSGRLFARILTHFLTAAVFLAGGLALFIEEIVRIPVGGVSLIHPAYWEGLPVVPVVLASYVFHGAYVNFMASITLSKRTDLLVWATFLGAAVNVGANFALIPRMGMMGAAWATLGSYAAMAACLYWMGRRVHPIPYETGKIAHLAAAAAAAWGVHALLPEGASLLPRLGLKAAALSVLPASLWLTGFFRASTR